MKISVIIPALNEEACIGELVSAIPWSVANEVIVVDNGSTDRTAQVARDAGARVVAEPRRGYGSARMAGTAAAHDADVLVFMDGDLSDDPAELSNIVAPILAGEADLVLGMRVPIERGVFTPQQAFGNALALFLIGILFGTRLRDLPSFKAIRRTTLEQMNLKERTYGWTTELVVKAAKSNVRIVEVPTPYRKRAAGRSKISSTVRGTIGAGYSILTVIFRYAFWRAPGIQPRQSPS